MKKEDHKKILDTLLGLCPDDKKAEMTGHLLTLEQDYKEQLALADDTKAKMDALEKQNKDYAEVNTRLFLERAGAKPDTDTANTDDDVPDETPPEKLSYDNLVL